jgi:hypothetical protein
MRTSGTADWSSPAKVVPDGLWLAQMSLEARGGLIHATLPEPTFSACKVDAAFGEIKIGDLLTTSPSAGYAMKASDQEKAFGTIVGKALQPLASGKGIIPILIALQ